MEHIPAPGHAEKMCEKKCEHGSECLLLKDHQHGHETQHGCVFYDAVGSTKLRAPGE